MGRRLCAAAGTLAVLALAGCGGDGAKPDPIEPGSKDAKAGSPEFGDNTVRIPGTSPEDVGSAALLAMYPPEEDKSPLGWVVYAADDILAAASGSQFTAAPVNAGLLPVEHDFVPPAPADLLERVSPPGFPNGEGLEAVMIDELGDEVVTSLEDAEINFARIAEPTPADDIAELVPFRGGWAQSYSDTIVIASSAEDARGYLFPAMSWSAFSGDTLALVDGADIPPATEDLVSQREDLRLFPPTVYLVGPESAIPESVADRLATYGTVKRIPGETPIEVSVEMARYHDEKTAFGWGIESGPANVLLGNLSEPEEIAAAIGLSGAGPKAPLLLTDDPRRLPTKVTKYIGELRNRDGNQGFAIGGPQSISSGLLAELDHQLEPGEPPGGKPKKEKN